jgi:hypothetical protein
MCTARLAERVPSAARAAAHPFRARLIGYSLRFHKKSTAICDCGRHRDQSGKANAFRTGQKTDVVWGVVFDIDPAQKIRLDDAEGLGQGYSEASATVHDEADRCHLVFIYLADDQAIDNSLTPYTWYKRFVVEGAKQHCLPVTYVDSLETICSVNDPCQQRTAKHQEITCGSV